MTPIMFERITNVIVLLSTIAAYYGLCKLYYWNKNHK